MGQDPAPDLRYANHWLRDAQQQLLKLSHEHNDSRLKDLAATIGDIAVRGTIISRYSQVPTVEQLNAVRARTGDIKAVLVRPFDLPEDYIQLVYEDGFTCGIAPDGSVSS